MPKLNPQGKIAMGVSSSHALSYDGNPLIWDNNAPSAGLIGTFIVGDHLAWLSNTLLIFSVPGAGLYTYNINTRACAMISATTADVLVGNGSVWAAWKDGVGYVDSESRTHANWVPVGVDDDGTVLIYLTSAHKGLAYLSKTDTTPIVITQDQIIGSQASIRRGIVIYRANGVLNRFRIAGENVFLNTDISQLNSDALSQVASPTTSIPVQHFSNDGNYVVGWHTGGLGLVVFKFGESVGWILGDRVANFNPDIRILSDGRIVVATSQSEAELSSGLTRYVIDVNDTQYYLFLDKITGVVVNSSVPDTRDMVPVVATDVVTTYQHTSNNSGQGVASLLRSSDWFGANGAFLRGAWQYGVTAVVATTNTSGNSVVTVIDSAGHTWSAGEPAYGEHSVAIRVAPSSTNVAPLWQVIWVRGDAGTYGAGNSYASIILDSTLVATGALTETANTFSTLGMLDVDNSGVPIPAKDHQNEWYGYIRLQLATTRGDWTIGQDAGTAIDRILAWNSAEQQAYVVWNGTTVYQSRLTLEYDVDGNPTAAVTPSQLPILVRQTQFLPLSRTAYETGTTPGITPVPAGTTGDSPSPTSTGQTSIAATDPTETLILPPQEKLPANALMKDTRVFREPQSVTPPPSVVDKLKAGLPAIAAGAIAATAFGSMSKMFSEEPAAYNPQYPYNTVIHESESGHLIEADDSPGAERIHIMHRSGSHIEMRPDGGVKYKTVKRRQDVTIGEHEIYVAGDCNIVTEGGYTIHIRKGELVIDAKHGASINVKGQLKMHADNIELKAKNNIFLNAPKVDIGAIAPSSRPMLSLPSGILPYPPTSPVTFVPKVTPGIIGKSTFTKLPSVKDAVSSPGKLFKALSNSAFDVAGEPAFSRLAEQPTEIPLSSPKVYANTSTVSRIQFRDRLLDTPEDVNNHEAYTSHINLCLELEDYAEDAKELPGQVYQSDTATPAPEPHPPLSFPLVSGGTAQFTHNSATVTGVGTMFTEDVMEGYTIRRADSDITAVIKSIQDDTTLILTEPWVGSTGAGVVEIYRLRPFKEFFGTYTYTDASALGTSGLTLGSLLVNFASPVFEVPKINAASFTTWTPTGKGSGMAWCGSPDPKVPNVFTIIKQVFASQTWNLSSVDAVNGCGRFIEAVLVALPPEWGHVKKTPDQKQYNGHAIDAIMYKSPTPLYNEKNGQVVDIIIGAGDPGAKINWLPICAPSDTSLWYR